MTTRRENKIKCANEHQRKENHFHSWTSHIFILNAVSIWTLHLITLFVLYSYPATCLLKQTSIMSNYLHQYACTLYESLIPSMTKLLKIHHPDWPYLTSTCWCNLQARPCRKGDLIMLPSCLHLIWRKEQG